MSGAYTSGELGSLLFSSEPGIKCVSSLFDSSDIYKAQPTTEKRLTDENAKVLEALGNRVHNRVYYTKKGKVRIRPSKREKDEMKSAEKSLDDAKRVVEVQSPTAVDVIDEQPMSTEPETIESEVPFHDQKKMKGEEELNVGKKRTKKRENTRMRSVFVGNIPKQVNGEEMTLAKIKKFLSKFGTVTVVKPIGQNFQTKRAFYVKSYKKRFDMLNTKNMKCINVHAIFEHIKEAEMALENNGIMMAENHIRIDRVDTTRNPMLTVFVGNIPFDATEESIWKLFNGNDDKVEGVRIVRDQSSQKGKGIAYVLFKDKAAMGEALLMDGIKFRGRELRVKLCFKTTKSDSKSPFPDGKLRQADTSSGNFEGRRATELTGVARRLTAKGKLPRRSATDRDSVPRNDTFYSKKKTNKGSNGQPVATSYSKKKTPVRKFGEKAAKRNFKTKRI